MWKVTRASATTYYVTAVFCLIAAIFYFYKLTSEMEEVRSNYYSVLNHIMLLAAMTFGAFAEIKRCLDEVKSKLQMFETSNGSQDPGPAES